MIVPFGKEFFKYLIFIIIEVKLLFLLEVSQVKPSIFLIFFILDSLRRGNPISGVIIGFTAGLFLDFFNVDYLGLSSLTLCLIGFICGYIGQSRDKMTKTQIFGLSLCMIFIHVFIYNFIKGFHLDPYHLYIKIIVSTIFYTSLLQILVTYFIPYSKKKRNI